MEEFVERAPKELNDAELAAVAGGFSVSVTSSSVTVSSNNSSNIVILPGGIFITMKDDLST
jgi:hypothetical protein